VVGNATVTKENFMFRSLTRLCFILLVAANAAAQPSINSLSGTTVTRSGRLLIQGSGFGAAQGAGRIEIGGLVAPLTRWGDTLIAAYVPESTPTGTATVQVFTATGASSNTMPVGITLRDLPGQIRWRFEADADSIPSRPALAADGTAYAIDAAGHLYALAPDGGLIWIFNATGSGPGNVSVGPDGTVYTGTSTAIFALAADGTLKWRFAQTPGAFILLGPNVGPDGNIYAVATDGVGVFSLTPQGSLRWAAPESYSRPIVTLQEIVFAPAPIARLYFHANDHFVSFGLDGTPIFSYVDGVSQGDQQPAVSPDGSVYTNLFDPRGPGLMLGKFDDNGNLLWHVFDNFTTSTNTLSTPEVGSDSVVYDGRNLTSLYSFNPGSTVRWQYTDSGILFAPIASPINDLIFVGGVAAYGQPGFFAAVSTSGVLRWKISLPTDNGLNIVPASRARFTTDGQTAYIGTSIPGQTADGHSFLYSVVTGSAPAIAPATLTSFTLNPATVVGGNASSGTVALSAPAPSGGAAVSLTSGNSSVATVPASVTISAGATSASFTANTSSVTTVTGVQISASYSGAILSATLTVQPASVPPPTTGPVLSSLSLAPSTVRAGSPSQGTVTLTGAAPAGGMQIALSSDNTSVATVPTGITVPAGASSAVFTVQTRRIRTSTSVTISASGGGVTKQATLVVRR
jgi:putative pyrroloquinoline-quinone-binding quinoprotein/IPT/TIG domain-containing protein